MANNSSNEPLLSVVQRTVLVGVAALLIASSGLLIKASQVDGVILYSKFSVTLFSESLKLTIAAGFWIFHYYLSSSNAPYEVYVPFPTWRDLGLFSIPGSLYLINNNLRYLILERINPGVFAVVWNLKVVGIALLLWTVLKRPMSHRQWFGVALLILGSSLAESSQWGSKEEEEEQETTNQQLSIGREAHIQGLVLLVFGLSVVSFANVACEYVYKSSPILIPLYKQNVVLYSWGLTLNLLAWLVSDAHEDLLNHYTGWTIAVIVFNGVSGYLVGAMFKYMDSIAAIFADLLSMLISAVVAFVFFELDANPVFCSGFFVSSASIWVYYGKGDDEPLEKEHQSGSDEEKAGYDDGGDDNEEEEMVPLTFHHRHKLQSVDQSMLE